MRRKIVYCLSAFFVLGVLFCSGFVLWVLGTAGGARWLMEEVSSHTTVAVEAKKVEGKIWGDLELESLTARWPGGELDVESLHISWDPLRLLYGRVAVREIILRKVHVRDDRPETAGIPEIAWPRVTGLMSRIDADVDVFNMEGLTYRRLKTSPVILNDVNCKIRWRSGVLTILNVRAGSQYGRAEGTLKAGLVTPSLFLELAVFPLKPQAGLNMISVDAEIRGPRAAWPLKGEIHLVGNSDDVPRIELRSKLQVDRRAIRLVDFRVTRIVRGGAVTGSGEVVFSEGGPRFHLSIESSGVDLSPLLHTRTDLSAHIVFEGTPADYRGRLELSNRGGSLRSVHIAGSLRGGREGLQIDFLKGSWLEGTILGVVHAGWVNGVSFHASLKMRDIDPSSISSEWAGRINADVNGSVLLSGGPLSASFDADLLRSSLRGKALTGQIKAGLLGSNLRIDHILLHGNGFDITARGDLGKRIVFSADAGDLSGLIPGWKGLLQAAGWARWHGGLLTGKVEGRARKIEAGNLRIGSADFKGHFYGDKGHPLQLRTTLSGLLYNHLEISSARLSVGGTLEDHVIELAATSPGATIEAKLSGGYKGGKWLGRIADLSEKDGAGVLRLNAPSDLLVSAKKFSLSPLVMIGSGGERIEAGGELAFHPLDGSLDTEWASVDLGRSNHWLKDVEVKGKSSGKAGMSWVGGLIQKVSLQAEASGSFVVDDQKIMVRRASVQVVRDEQRLLVSLDLGVGKAATLRGRFSSLVKRGVLLPEKGTVDAELDGLDLSLFKRWMPEGIEARGTITGAVNGKLLPGGGLDIAGGASIAGGAIDRLSEKGKITVQLRKADVKFDWSNSSLNGTVSLVLQDHGHVEGSFDLPLKASLEPSMEENGQVSVSMEGQFEEKGLFTAFFPGTVQETHGRIDMDIDMGGTWKQPVFKGKMQLSKAGAYFPAGGIRIEDAGMSAHLEGDRLTIDSFQASSGPGKIKGAAEMRLKEGTIVSYRGTLQGKDFQVMYLPELRIEASPDISFEGSPGKLSVRGEVKLPYLLVLQSKTKTTVEPSRDVRIVEKKPPPKEMKTAIDIQVNIVLGDRVFVKAEGIDAQMGGSVDVTARGMDDIRGRGEIHVVKGKYSAYGVSLDVERGRVIFSGQKVNRPALDVLAIRKTGDVKAGVTVTGTLQNPVVKLYSEPSMADTDILAYIVLGHPLGGGQQQQADLVARAAGFLLSASDSVVFQDQLKHRLGIDTLDIESVKTGETTAPGTGQEGVSRSLVTVGKYLTPSLYISYGRSLLGDTNLFRVRYSLSRHWEVETESGTESGADIFYRIDLK